MKANYPVEFLAASMTLDMGNTDKLSEFRGEAERLGITVEPPSINRSGVDFEVEGNKIIYALAALKGVGGQAVEAIVAARGERAVPRSLRLRAAHQSARGQQARAGKPGRGRRLRRARAEPRARASRRSRPCWRRRSARMTPRRSGRTNCSADRRSARRSRCRGSSRGCRPTGCSANTRRSASSSPAIRSTITPRCSSACRCRPGRSSRAAVKAGATAGRVAATVVSRTERRTKTGNKMGIIGLSDPSGQYEAILFSEGLAAISRPARARRRRAAVPGGRSAGRRRARPHPVGGAARSGGQQAAEEPAHLSCGTDAPLDQRAEAAASRAATARSPSC